MKDKTPLISDLKFIPVNRKGSLIGYCSFIYDANIAIKDIAVHERADKSGLRLRYPVSQENKERSIIHPINIETQQLLDNEITAYVKANYKINK